MGENTSPAALQTKLAKQTHLDTIVTKKLSVNYFVMKSEFPQNTPNGLDGPQKTPQFNHNAT